MLFSAEPSVWLGLENKITLLVLEEKPACFALTFDQNNSPNKEADDTCLNIFPEDRTRENKQAGFEGFWLDIWKRLDTTKITKYQNGLLRGAQESTPLEVFQTRTDSLSDLPGMA